MGNSKLFLEKFGLKQRQDWCSESGFLASVISWEVMSSWGLWAGSPWDLRSCILEPGYLASCWCFFDLHRLETSAALQATPHLTNTLVFPQSDWKYSWPLRSMEVWMHRSISLQIVFSPRVLRYYTFSRLVDSVDVESRGGWLWDYTGSLTLLGLGTPSYTVQGLTVYVMIMPKVS